jgi:uncharacterized protein YbaR (Trm112 family)
MDIRMLELLVCPVCKGPLERDHDTDELICRADRLAYPIRDGVPVMLESEARHLDAAPGEPAPLATAPGPTG